MINQHMRRTITLASLGALTFTLAACGNQTSDNQAAGGGETGAGSSELSGSVVVDGSSTVFPVSEAMAEEFQREYSGVRVTVGVSGTGGGFQKFCNDETDISGASRPIKQSEIEKCEQNGVEFIELPIAFDGLTVVKHPNNDFVECMTVQELKTIWEPEAQGEITNWNQVRDSFPDRPLGLYGAGTDSGTFDYFTSVIVGEEGASRGDYTSSEDDNVIVQGVANDENALGYFGLAYFEENKEKLAAIAIDDENPDNGEGCIEPNAETVGNGTYQPLARPEFIYVKKSSAENNPAVQEFVNFYLDPENNGTLVPQVGYVAVPDQILEKAQARFENRTVGSVFEGGSVQGVKLNEVL
ncbi:MAG: phosphate-binding protein [Cyanobacteria bacterium SW_9_44_58]|nr:MAG: phosphate-binding protein [Cyanobacteria bacterium SW_9_44_58]